MIYLGKEISEDGITLWRSNGNKTERIALYSHTPRWETVADPVADPCPHTAEELKTFCKEGGFGYAEGGDVFNVLIIQHWFDSCGHAPETVQFEVDDHDRPLMFANVADAQSWIDEVLSDGYCLSHNERAGAEYIIVDCETNAGFGHDNESWCLADMSNYNWDDAKCECGQCNTCINMMIAQDVERARAAEVSATAEESPEFSP
jgi:hypothetical protein